MAALRPLRLSLVLNAVLAVASIALCFVAVLLMRGHMEDRAIGNADAAAKVMIERDVAIHAHFRDTVEPGARGLQERAGESETLPAWATSKEALRAIAGSGEAGGESHYFKECVQGVTNGRHAPDAGERAFLRDLAARTSLTSRRGPMDVDGAPTYVVLERGAMSWESCLRCHEPNGKGGWTGIPPTFDFAAQDRLTAISVRIPLSDAYAGIEKATWELGLILVGLVVALFASQFLLYRGTMFRPLARIRDKASRIATLPEHVGEQIPAPFASELREVTHSFNAMSRRLKEERDSLEERVKQRTADLASLTERYQRLFQSMTEGVALHDVILDADGVPTDYRFLEVNPAFEQVTGLSAANILGRTAREVLPPEEAERWIRTCGQVALSGETTSFEDVDPRRGRTRAVTVFSPEEGRFVAVIEDITDSRHAEATLRENARLLAEAQAIGKLGHWTLDLDTGRVTWSDELFNLLGRDRRLGSPGYRETLSYFPPAEARRLVRGVREAIREARRVEMDLAVKTGEGTGATHALVITPAIDEDGRVTRLTGVAQDVTQRRVAEDERQRMATQVQEAQKLESLAILAGGIAHDFNNLLMSVLGHADLALTNLPETSRSRDSLERIHKAAQRAAELSRQMLAYSGKGHFVLERVALTDIVREMAHLLERPVAEHVVLRYDLSASMAPIEADIAQLRQIILNLVRNAAEAIGEGPGVITIATRAIDCDADYLAREGLAEDLEPGPHGYVEVSDTGCGMDAETRARLFDPFFTTKFPGRGLGLAAVFGIVRGHRGTIRVYSEEGRGSTFRILFPTVEPEAESVEPPKAPVPDSWQAEGTVLVVDDEEAVGLVAQRMLEHMGFDVLLAASGPDGLGMFQMHQDEIVLVLMDLTMPEMGGEEVFRRIRSLRADVPIVLSSGYGEHDALSRFTGKDLAAFIQKPYQLVALQRVLSQVLSSRGETA